MRFEDGDNYLGIPRLWNVSCGEHGVDDGEEVVSRGSSCVFHNSV